VIVPMTVQHLPDVLAFNNAHAIDLSQLDKAGLAALHGWAFYAIVVPPADAFLIALDHTAGYGSPNYAWHRARYDRFVYVDRLAVAPHTRGQGLARRMYASLFAASRAAGHTQVLCEVNIDPPNLASDALHASLGFVCVGEAQIHGGAKTVRYYRVPL